MSWFTDLISAIFGRPRKKDRPIPNPLPGSASIRISTDGTDRAQEAVSAILGYVRAPYQITDRLIVIKVVTWAEGKAYFKKYGYKESDWKSNREGNFYPPKPGVQVDGLIHLVAKSLDQNRRTFLAIHEYSHCCWYYLLLDVEWNAWFALGATVEDFADDLTRRLMGDGLDSAKVRYFDALEKRLAETGSKSIRL